ncbi:hypothetical protein AHAS_Ahas04G0159900 [Arachis hypogaea]
MRKGMMYLIKRMRAILLGFLTPSLLSVLSLHLETTALSNCLSALVLGLIKMNMMMLQI